MDAAADLGRHRAPCGHPPGYPASHGCIRLPASFARQLYELTDLGATVSVVDVDIDEPGAAPFAAAPKLYADASTLGGDSFNIVTVGADAAARDEAVRRPASWMTGPAVEIVQPLPANAH